MKFKKELCFNFNAKRQAEDLQKPCKGGFDFILRENFSNPIYIPQKKKFRRR